MKKYKGWELIKMANEGKIKNGEEFKEVDGSLYIKFVNLDGRFSFSNKENVEVGNSYFTRDHIYIKKQKSLTFFEAMKAVDEGKKVTNDYLQSIDSEYYYSKFENGSLQLYDNEEYDYSEIDVEELNPKTKWYIYED